MMIPIKFLSFRKYNLLRIFFASILSLSILTATDSPIDAAEDAKQFYLLGSKGSLAGIVPPPGTYLSFGKYFYSGDASGRAAVGVILDQVGDITVEANVDLELDLFFEIPTAIWVSPRKVLGGHIGFGILLPIGWQDISADIDAQIGFNLPNGTPVAANTSLSLTDDTFNFGDPVLTSFIGWHRGNWHWSVSGLLNVPIGAYDEDNIVNMGFNRWALDTSVAATWFDQARGHEASVVAGITVNAENPDTDYKTGTEFHAEFALMRHFSPAFAIGIAGYHYQQLTGDSGAGATLGDFKGRVTALGPNVNYNFQFRGKPVSTTLRWLHEFDTENRMEGDAVFFSATVPLGGPRH